MNILIFGIVIFVMSVIIIELLFYAFRAIRNPNRTRIQKRLRTFAASEFADKPQDILKKRVLSDIPFLNHILLDVPGILRLARLLRQANVRYTLGFFIQLTLVLALSGFLGSYLMTRNHGVSIIFAALLGATPYSYLLWKKKKRMEKFVRQLPEGLELIARALKAGHAFTTGMKLAADEFDDPLGPEFDETLEEINFGVSVQDALESLAHRIDCPDLKYFVVSVILQRETGGNLAEIIESIAYIIRERFKFQGKIRILSSEGRRSANILVALSFAVVIALKILSPEYIDTLLSEPAGKITACICALMMVIGFFAIKRIITIKV